jgi:8-oxo-dGTP pyrophosphatase MutT (NUDIX family)
MRRHKAGMDYYSVPGGKIEPGETPERTAVREIQEETSMTVQASRLLGTLRNQDRTEYYFLAERFEGRPQLGGPELQRQSPENHYELEWVQADRVPGVGLMPPAIRGVCADLAAGRAGKGPWL